MLDGLFNCTSIPIMEQVVNFTQARQSVLAGNIANLDTPGYQVRDLSVEDFQGRLAEAIAQRRASDTFRSPGDAPPDDSPTNLAEIARDSPTVLRHDKSNVGMEFQVTEMVKNHIQHNMALSIMNSQLRLLQAAISERA